MKRLLLAKIKSLITEFQICNLLIKIIKLFLVVSKLAMEHEILLLKFDLFVTTTPINLYFLFVHFLFPIFPFSILFPFELSPIILSASLSFPPTFSVCTSSISPVSRLLPLSTFRIHLLSSLPRPHPTTPRDSPRLSSVIPSPFLVPPFSPLSFPPPPSLSFSLSDPSFPLPPPHFIENVWYAGAFYTGTKPPPPLSGLMAGKEQPGRLLVRTFVSCTRGHAEMWPSTCSQGFEARAHARTQAHYREGSE